MPQDFDLDQFKSTYFEECQDLLAAAEEYLVILQNELSDVDVETLHAIFRCVHSIKGGAGTFNYTELVRFSHVFEALLDKLRDGQIEVTKPLVKTLFSANDVLMTLVQKAQDNEAVDPSIWEPKVKELEAFAKGSAASKIKSSPFDGYNKTPQEEDDQGWGLFIDDVEQDQPDPTVEELSEDISQTEELEEKTSPPDEINLRPSVSGKAYYRIQFVPDRHLLRFANEPLLLSRELATLGECHAFADISNIPSLNDIKADEAYLSWVFELISECSISDVQEVFEFVVDDCDLKIEKQEGRVDAPSQDTVAQEDQKAAPISEVSAIDDREKEDTNPLKLAPPSQNLTEEQTSAVKKEPSKGEGGSSASAHKVSSIRVELDRVDKLVNMVGELVISQAMLMEQAEKLPGNSGNAMAQNFENLSAHTRHLQESVMAIRMQPVKSVFARMPRLVRELSAKLNKKVDLITSGEMTEVDKTVIEQLMDPITHMIRNSLDHGVETPEDRLASGKPERATIQLNAEHRSGRIQIEVIDDGYGINRKRILEKAIAKGIVRDDDELRDDEIDELIFVPGFSTAKEISNISGRGVGMDVVRRNIVNLGGRISVFSVPGKGTRFLLSLPLTLAVLDGMIVTCGGEKYIIPLTSIIENIHPLPEELKKLSADATLVSVRGEYIRLINLHRLFNIKDAIKDPVDGLVVIVETERYGLVGVLVDELIGQQQVVIKSLEENYDPISGVAAATILGNGKVALILDVDGLAAMEHGTSRRKFNELSKQVLLTGEQTHDAK